MAQSKAKSDSPAVFVFRRDLRLSDNRALARAAKHSKLYLLFVVDPLSEHLGGASKWWLHHALVDLEQSIKAQNQQLHFLSGDSAQEVLSFCQKNCIEHVYSSRGYTPRERDVDANLIEAFSDQKLHLHLEEGGYLFEPETACKADGTPYRVFTPFWRNFCRKELSIQSSGKVKLPVVAKPNPTSQIRSLGLLPNIKWDKEFYPVWEPTQEGARKALKGFVANAASGYKDQRDIPGVAGTSRLSPYLAFGQLSVRQIWTACIKKFGCLEEIESTNTGVYTYLKELGWREFANHLIHHFPDTVDSELRPAFRKFPWKKKSEKGMKAKLSAWQKGNTGIPIVDAGMRQLWQTGWMHNRVRMIVASFLVKNLGLDWRLGAEWFMDTLVDADLASNTMGWQWAAGSGADAAPYFRIFNPVLQGERFDKQGAYVKKFVPELKDVEPKYIHKPWELAPIEAASISGYPEPVVDLKESRQEALARYQAFK